MWKEAISIVIVFVTFVILRTMSLLKQIHQERSLSPQERSKRKEKQQSSTQKRTKPATTLIVLGSGGHTTEMMSLQFKLNPNKYKPIVHVIATTDHTSEDRINAQVKQNNSNDSNSSSVKKADVTYRTPRSREVGQSYISSIFTTLYAFVYAIWIVWKVQPDLVLCNGPGTCLPIVVISFVMGKWRRILFGGSNPCTETKIIFVESFCRVQHLSLTGKLLYPIVDRFIVHWDELHAKFPKSDLVETFVRRR